MLSINAIKPLNRWDFDSIRPGVVGSVGDVNLQPKLKHSNPDMPLRWEKAFAKQNEPRLGSNVQDGYKKSYDSKGRQAKSTSGYFNLEGRRFKTQRGWKWTDLRAPDTFVEPRVTSLGDYQWRNKVAKVYEAKRTGNKFLPLPGAYVLPLGQVPRGGMTPVTVMADQGNRIPGSAGSVVTGSQNNMGTFVNNYPQPAIAGNWGGNPRREGVTNLGEQTLTRAPEDRSRPRLLAGIGR